MGLRVVKTQRETLDADVLLRAIDIKFLKFRTTVPDPPTGRSPVEFYPFGGAGQRMHQPYQMYLPGANGPIKVMLTISFCVGPFSCGFRFVRIRLRHHRYRVARENQTGY